MAEPRPDSAPACEYLNVHEDAVAQVLAALPDDETLYDLSELFRVFGDSTRIKILYVLYSLDDDHVRSVLAIGMEHVLEK